MQQYFIKFVLSLLIFFGLLFIYTKLAGPIPFTVKNINSQLSDSFTVTGQGKSVVVPDTAVVSLGVSVTGTTVKEAQDKMNKTISQVILEIKKLKIDEKDIQTENYIISPNYDNIRPLSNSASLSPNLSVSSSPAVISEPVETKLLNSKITGYTATTNLSIKVKDSQLVNQVIDSGTKNGANQIGGVQFTVEDKTQAENEARSKAVAEARKKAQETAKAAGFRLGKMISYNENLNGPPILYNKAQAVPEDMSNPMTEIQPGSTEIVVNVTLGFEMN